MILHPNTTPTSILSITVDKTAPNASCSVSMIEVITQVVRLLVKNHETNPFSGIAVVCGGAVFIIGALGLFG
jgi:hypothetical protein